MKRRWRRLLRKLRKLVERRGVPALVRAHQDVIIEEYRRCRKIGMNEENAVMMSCTRFLRHVI